MADKAELSCLSEDGEHLILYPIGSSGQTLVLSDVVIAHFDRHRQRRWRQREAGGQLFARFDGPQILVEEATGPRRGDLRTRTSYVPDRRAEQQEIFSRHEQGLHYVGDWHSHPEMFPVPSDCDVRSIGDCVAQSTHTLNAFVLIVVGRADLPAGLHVSLHNGRQTLVLQPAIGIAVDKLIARPLRG